MFSVTKALLGRIASRDRTIAALEIMIEEQQGDIDHQVDLIAQLTKENEEFHRRAMKQ
jgi:hypothetical protein